MFREMNEFDKYIVHTTGRVIEMSKPRHKSAIRGVLKHDEPMANHTSWRAGGKAERYFEPADLDDLRDYIANIPADEPLLWIGLGSNLLVRDGGFRGTVVAINGVLNELEIRQSGQVRVGVGVPAFGMETWDIVTSVEVLNRSGQQKIRSRNEFEIGYRHVQLTEDEWFIAAELVLQVDKQNIAEQRIRELLAKRSATQPTGQLSCGSVFRNPPDDYAARLIESCGLKGKRIGNACVSEKHANFIINMGGATANEIEQLIMQIKDVVMRECNVELAPEVRIVGDA
ncbi:MAG: UDP-N-acetylenolpyruvoylglucosamine reductase [Gammaproteobacteria bacterium]|nr:UDP-N-acetylenolpyruvoylglucosamine reductase [Gammaproteobacteria bacterium]